MGTWEGMHSQQLRPEIKNSVRMSTFISAGHRRLMLLHSPPPVAAPSSGSDVSRLPLHISHPIFTFHGHFMVVLIVLILITYIFMAIVSFRRRFSMRSGGNVGALIVTSHSSQGLDPEAIDKLPIAVFYRSENVSVGAIDSKGLDSIKGDPSQASKDENNAGPVVHHSREWKCLSECAICLSDFKEQECIRMLPKCQHCFHKECIQSWLGSHSTCPLCRSNLLSLPKAVSLSSDTTSSSHGS